MDEKGEKQDLRASTGAGGRSRLSAQCQEQNFRQRVGPRWRSGQEISCEKPRRLEAPGQGREISGWTIFIDNAFEENLIPICTEGRASGTKRTQE